VFQNGASVVHLPDGESRSSPLPPAVVDRLVVEARANGRILELYADGEAVTERDLPWAREHAGLLGIPFEPRPFETLSQPVVRAQWLLPHAEAAPWAERGGGKVEIALSSSPLMPDTTFVGITARGVSKGSALRTIAAALEIPLEEVMYVGDAGNDLPALRIVGHPVAMGNADEAVRAAARQVVGSVEHGGLAEALEIALPAR
jgi:hydroxymethylpyrimidine pyrophosphatase-like HAD family hydrolase